MKALAALVLMAFCAAFAAPASAQDRGASVYTVSGVRVDVTAASAAQARPQAFERGSQTGFQRLVRRLTLPDDVTRLGMPQPTQPQLDALISSIDVEDERLSGTRYLGRLAVRFNPARTRDFLRGLGFVIVDTRTTPILVIPQAPGAPPETADLWRQVWREGGYTHELAPLPVTNAPIEGPPSWSAAQSAAQSMQANAALFAVLRVSGRTASATLMEVASGGASRDRGAVQAQFSGGAEGLGAALASLAAQANDRVQGEWRARSATAGGGRARITVSALYANQAEWERIKDSLERAAATLVSEIRIEAVGREGALVSFAYVGDQGALVTELRRLGVSLENGPSGAVVRAVRR